MFWGASDNHYTTTRPCFLWGEVVFGCVLEGGGSSDWAMCFGVLSYIFTGAGLGGCLPVKRFIDPGGRVAGDYGLRVCTKYLFLSILLR